MEHWRNGPRRTVQGAGDAIQTGKPEKKQKLNNCGLCREPCTLYREPSCSALQYSVALISPSTAPVYPHEFSPGNADTKRGWP